MYTPKFEKPLGPAALKANLEYWLNANRTLMDQANVAMEEARKCIDALVEYEKNS